MSAQNINPWITASGSVIGRSHIVKSIPCQDYCAIQFLPENPSWGVAAVSDGAGSCLNSHLGSEKVVNTSIKLFTDLLVNRNWTNGEPLPDNDTWANLAQHTFRLIANDLKSYSEEINVDYYSLSATIIVVVFGPKGLLVAHIGDGRAAGQTEDGKWKALLSPFKGEEANMTVFITSNIWREDKIQEFIGSTVWPGTYRSFAIMSDGCEMGSFLLNRFDEANDRYENINEPFSPFFDHNVEALLTLKKQGKTDEEINTLWAQLLTNGTQRFADEPDDKTLILMVNQLIPIQSQVVNVPESHNSKEDKPVVGITIPKIGKMNRVKKQRGKKWLSRKVL